MEIQSAEKAQKQARVAGILYLLLFFVGPFSFFYVPSVVYVPGDPVATLTQFTEAQGLFRMGMMAESFIFLIEIVLSVLLFSLLRHVNTPIAIMALVARLMQSTIQGVNLFPGFSGLKLVNGGMGFSIDQVESLVTLMFNVHASGIMISQFFFGFHCLLIGYLLYKAGFFPKLLGILMMIAAVGYLLDSYGNLVLPQYSDIFTAIVVIPAVVAELSFTLYLLIKGVNVARWRESVEGVA